MVCDNRISQEGYPVKKSSLNEETKYCPDCEKEIPIDEFYLNRGKLERYCKVHKMIRQKFENAQKFLSPKKNVQPLTR